MRKICRWSFANTMQARASPRVRGLPRGQCWAFAFLASLGRQPRRLSLRELWRSRDSWVLTNDQGRTTNDAFCYPTKTNSMTRPNALSLLLLVSLFSVSAVGQTPAAPSKPTARPSSKVCSACIRAHEEFLASDAMNGRGSATHDEMVAAVYIASELRQYGIEPAGDDGGYLQRVALVRQKLSSPPTLQFTAPGAQETTYKHGLELVFLHVGEAEQHGPLQKIDLAAKPAPQIQKGAFVLLKANDNKVSGEDADKFFKAGAAAVFLPETPRYRAHWDVIKDHLFSANLELADASGNGADDKSTLIMLSNDAIKQMDAMPEGTVMKVVAPMEKPETAATWNAVGKIRGRDPKLRATAVLLTAHLDHLGVGDPVNGDSIYNGADDDASGTTAVLELARVLGNGPKPRRSVIFSLFGSEELGGFGSTYFREHSPVPLANISANLEFEMIGRPDSAVPADTLWLTGWERSNLGPTLAAHGAKLVGDPHPDQNFFARSDNYILAQKGVVAQTVSSYGMHKDYHQPSDDVAHLDLKHMDDAIQSLLVPVQWLVNSVFKPEWNAGGQP